MEFLRAYQLELLLGVAVLAVIELLIIFGLNSRVARTSKLLRQLLTGPTGENLEAQLNRALGESKQALDDGAQLRDELARTNAQLKDELARHDAALEGCVQKIGLVRYDAFGDVRGEQSFSLALLDGQSYGIVISALFGRNDSRFFGKSIRAGAADQTLSDEEEGALQMALQGGIGALSSDAGEDNKRRPARRRAKNKGDNE